MGEADTSKQRLGRGERNEMKRYTETGKWLLDDEEDCSTAGDGQRNWKRISDQKKKTGTWAAGWLHSQFAWYMDPTDHWHHCSVWDPPLEVCHWPPTPICSALVTSYQRQLSQILATLFNNIINVLKIERYSIITNVAEKQPSRNTGCDGEQSVTAMHSVTSHFFPSSRLLLCRNWVQQTIKSFIKHKSNVQTRTDGHKHNM